VSYQVDPAHTGNQPASRLTPPLTKQWTINLSGGVSYPIIVEGRVFVTVANLGSYGTKLHALDLQTGAPLWGPINLAGTYFWSNAAYEDGRIYVVNFDGRLTAFDAASGSTLWTRQLPGQYDFSSPPTAAGGRVFVGGAGSGGTLYGVDGATGNLLWTASVMNGMNSSPAVSATGVYVSYVCAQSYGFTPNNGSLLWHHSTSCEGGGGKTPVLYNGKVWVRDWAIGNVVLDAATGASMGAFSANTMPAFAGTRGYFLTSGVLQARDVDTMSLLWTFSGDGTLASPPLVVNDTVYIGSSAGGLYALDGATGSQQWSDQLAWGISASDEQNVSQPLAGMGAGGNALLVPAGSHLVCYR
jgi:outer membrane protein assembly factor BamB